MEFAYTPRLAELKDRARTLTEKIIPFEDECERNNGLCPDSHASIKAAVLDSGLQAINTPAEFGGAGLSVLEQVVVQDELGKLTNALWDTVWRPANPLAHATPEQRERYLIPGARGDRRDAVAISEAGAGSDFSAALTSATPDGDGGYVINGEKWFVTVGDVADYLIVLAYVQPEHAPTMFLVDVDTPGVKITNVPRYTHTFVYEHPEFTFENVHVGRDAVLGEVGAGLELTRDWFTEERLMIGARTIGAAERALTLAVDDDGGAGDIPARRRGKEGDHPGDFVRGAEAPERYCSLPPSALSTRWRTAASSLMSAGTASARVPSASISEAAFSKGSGRRPQITISAPQRARSSATARPMPVPPPVTNATVPR